MAIGETLQAFLEESIRSHVHARHALAEIKTEQKSQSVLLLSADRELIPAAHLCACPRRARAVARTASRVVKLPSTTTCSGNRWRGTVSKPRSFASVPSRLRAHISKVSSCLIHTEHLEGIVTGRPASPHVHVASAHIKSKYQEDLRQDRR